MLTLTENLISLLLFFYDLRIAFKKCDIRTLFEQLQTINHRILVGFFIVFIKRFYGTRSTNLHSRIIKWCNHPWNGQFLFRYLDECFLFVRVVQMKPTDCAASEYGWQPCGCMHYPLAVNHKLCNGIGMSEQMETCLNTGILGSESIHTGPTNCHCGAEGCQPAQIMVECMLCGNSCVSDKHAEKGCHHIAQYCLYPCGMRCP
jgi:hypothetical protein